MAVKAQSTKKAESKVPKNPAKSDPDDSIVKGDDSKDYGIAVSDSNFTRYTPAYNQELLYSHASMELNPLIRKNYTNHMGNSKSATSGFAARKSDRINSIELKNRIRLIEFVQDPYTDSEKQRFEAAARRNWAIRSGISVREHFVFGKGSDLIIELPEDETKGLTDEEQKKLLDKKLKDNPEWEEARKEIENFDVDVGLESALPVFYWQNIIFGKGAILKILHHSEERIVSFMTVNSRRLMDPILDRDNNMSFEGLWVDGQPLSKEYVIYGTYQPVQISPHTEWFGYSPIEPIIHVAEGLNIFYEEDVKEIQRSAWLASVLLEINTAGLTKPQARSRIESVIKEIKPGKFIGINQMGIVATQLKLETDLKGLQEVSEAQESKIYKSLQVPQFLVQSEDIANRATADKSAALFLTGVISKDQEWIENLLAEQHYDPLLKQILRRKEVEEVDERLPFHVRRRFKQAQVSEFVDLATAIKTLIDSGVWDVQKANEVLESDEVTERVKKEKEEAKKEFEPKNDSQEGDKDPFNNQDKKDKPGEEPDEPRENTSS